MNQLRREAGIRNTKLHRISPSIGVADLVHGGESSNFDRRHLVHACIPVDSYEFPTRFSVVEWRVIP